MRKTEKLDNQEKPSKCARQSLEAFIYQGEEDSCKVFPGASVLLFRSALSPQWTGQTGEHEARWLSETVPSMFRLEIKKGHKLSLSNS